MAGFVTIKLDGLENTLKGLQKKDKEISTFAHEVLKNAAKVIANEAKNNVPVNSSKLKQSIEPIEIDYLTFEIKADHPYSAYVEFGTGGFVKIPPGFEKYAYTFYVNGKGRMHPHPYMFPAFFKYREQIVKDLKAQLAKGMVGSKVTA